VKLLNVGDDINMQQDSIWTALKQRDPQYLSTGFKKTGIVSTAAFSSNPMYNGIRYTGIMNAVYPMDPTLTGDNLYLDTTKVLGITTLVEPTTQGVLNQMVTAINQHIAYGGAVAPIPTVTEDDYYVFTEKFYNQTTDMTVLETVVWSYLNKTELDYVQLLATSKDFLKWGLLEQFYYAPIIMTLIRAAIRGL
jgi:hypothetical protein